MEKIAADLQKSKDKSQFERDKLAATSQLERDKLAQAKQIKTAELAAKVSGEHMKAEAEGKKQTTKDYADGFKLGLDAVKTAITVKKPNGTNK